MNHIVRNHKFDYANPPRQAGIYWLRPNCWISITIDIDAEFEDLPFAELKVPLSIKGSLYYDGEYKGSCTCTDRFNTTDYVNLQEFITTVWQDCWNDAQIWLEE